MSEDKVPLEDAAAPDAEHASDPETQGERERLAEADDQSEHLRELLDDAREAVHKAHEADSLASGGEGVQPQAVQDEGSGDSQ